MQGIYSIPSPCPLPAGEGLVRHEFRAVAQFPLPQGEGEGEGIGYLCIHCLGKARIRIFSMTAPCALRPLRLCVETFLSFQAELHDNEKRMTLFSDAKDSFSGLISDVASRL